MVIPGYELCGNWMGTCHLGTCCKGLCATLPYGAVNPEGQVEPINERDCHTQRHTSVWAYQPGMWADNKNEWWIARGCINRRVPSTK